VSPVVWLTDCDFRFPPSRYGRTQIFDARSAVECPWPEH
jgi:hypothetical protein